MDQILKYASAGGGVLMYVIKDRQWRTEYLTIFKMGERYSLVNSDSVDPQILLMRGAQLDNLVEHLVKCYISLTPPEAILWGEIVELASQTDADIHCDLTSWPGKLQFIVTQRNQAIGFSQLGFGYEAEELAALRDHLKNVVNTRSK
jgi:hypothetical protein